jgi:uncharacterized membrane protein
MVFLVAYIAAAIVFFGLDFVWLGTVAIGFYRRMIGPLMREKPNFAAAGLFYLLYIGGIVYFAIAPALAGGDWSKAAVSGGVFGFLAYATYDITNLSTLKNWPIRMCVVDIAWGTVATGLAATAGYAAVRSIVG